MIKASKNGVFVYIHRYADTKVPFYVGIGTGNRATENMNRSDLWKSECPEDYLIDVVYKGLEREDALQIEDDLIRCIGRKDLGRGPLLNQDGGVEYDSVSWQESSEIADIMRGIEFFESTLTPFPYSKLANYLGMTASELTSQLSRFNLKSEVAQSNERIDKELIRQALENGCFTNGEISRYTGVELSDRFNKRIEEVRNEKSED